MSDIDKIVEILNKWIDTASNDASEEWIKITYDQTTEEIAQEIHALDGRVEKIIDWLDIEILDAQTNLKLDPQFSKQYTGMVMVLKSAKQFIATLPEPPKD